ncbi:MAG: vWA domain-containing protein [Pseudomonadota bacterium]
MTLFRSFLCGAALAALLGSTALAQSPLIIEDAPDTPPIVLEIYPQVDPSLRADLMVERLRDFAQGMILEVRRDPARIPSEALIAMVAGLAMEDASGIAVTRGYDIDAHADLVLGTSQGSAQIILADRISPDGLEVLAVFRDETGQVMIPPASSISAYRTDGERLCLAEEAQKLEQAPTPPMSFALLLDTSGSMGSVMDDLRDAANGFLSDLPDSAQCYVGAFASVPNFSRSSGLGESSCHPRNFHLDGLRADGGTNLYDPMRMGYAWLNSQPENHQRAMIVITDGAANRNEHEIASLVSDKGDSVTFVYFLGSREERWLRGIADNYLAHDGHLAPQLASYFQVVSDAYAQQTVLRLGPCEDGTGP